MRNQLNWIPFLFLGMLVSCNGSQTETKVEVDSVVVETQPPQQDSLRQDIKVPLLRASIDQEAMDQIVESQEGHKGPFEMYDQPFTGIEAWTEKLWGRCCTEADTRFREYLKFDFSVKSDHSDYPFSNALDYDFNTTFVFSNTETNSITINMICDSEMYYNEEGISPCDLISDSLFIQERFELSIVNGYAKNETTFKENSRITEVELWKNGVHMCNCRLMDTPKVQTIKGNFSWYKNDEIVLVPVKTIAGEKYNDICISGLQLSLGYDANPKLDELGKNYNF